MYAKILEKLKTQRGTTSNVTDRSLEDLAKSLESIITTDDILNVADLSKAIESIDGNINHYTAAQVKAIEEKRITDTAKKAEDEAAKKADEEANKNKLPDDAPDYIKAIMEQNNLLMEQSKQTAQSLANLQGDKITTTRTEKMTELLKEAPEYYKNQIIEGFNNMTFENDEAFGSYLGKSKTNLDLFTQQAAEQGLNTSSPKAETKKPEKEELNPTFAAAMKAHDELKAKEKE